MHNTYCLQMLYVCVIKRNETIMIVSVKFAVSFNPLTHISQKTGSHFLKTHCLYKNRPS